MALLESIATKLVISLSSELITNGVASFNSQNEYQKELQKIINDTLSTYEHKYPSIETNKIPFYTSQTIVDELLKFRFSKKISIQKIQKALHDDKRILIPSESEIRLFLEMFDEQIAKSKKLRQLNLENNYKEEIFNISDQFLDLKNTVLLFIDEIKRELAHRNDTQSLIEEWSQQLEEIKGDIQNFKPKTALERLENIDKRINEGIGNVNNNLTAKICYLKASCLTELKSAQIDNKSAELYIKAHNLFPESIEFKVNAGLAYYSLNEITKAEELANAVLRVEEFNYGAWAIKCFLNETEIKEYLKTIPKVVFDKREFKIQLFHWLNYRKHVETIEDLDQFGISFQIDDANEPAKVTYKNRLFWTVSIEYFLRKFLQENSKISTTGYLFESKTNHLLIYVNKVLGKIVDAVKGSEIESSNIFFQFEFHYTNFLLSRETNDIYKMENLFKQLEGKTFTEIIQMVQGYNFKDTPEDTQKSIQVINEFGEEKNELLCLMNCYNYHKVKNIPSARESFRKFVNLQPILDYKSIYNIVQFFPNIYDDKNSDLKGDIDFIFENKAFNPPILNDFLQIVLYSICGIGTESISDVENKIQRLKSEIDGKNESLRYYMAVVLIEAELFEDAISYIREYVSEDFPSQDLRLLCIALYNSKTNKPELLALLEKWRKNYSPVHELLRMELELRHLQFDWKRIAEICELGVRQFPLDETFVYGLFLGYGEDLNTEAILSHEHLITKKEFQNYRFGIVVAGVLLKAGLKELSLETLYRLASKKDNKQARQVYVTSMINYPETLFKDFEVVELDTYVRYNFKDKNIIILVTAANQNELPCSALIGKRVGETFTFKRPMSSVLETGQILRVMDKYIALMEEILMEAENPLSGYKINVLKFEETDAGSISKKLIEEFGISGSLENERVTQVLENYHNGLISFSEVTFQAFHHKYFEAYFTLCSDRGFRTIPVSWSQGYELNETNKFIIDITSVCLFFQLTREKQINYSHKFIISPYLRKEVTNIIEETERMPAPKMSVNVTSERVIPYFYPEGFKEKKLLFYQELLKWIESNCVIDYVDERLNFAVQFEEDLKHSAHVQFLLDNRLLSERENYILLTNDTFYFTHLKGSIGSILSPEVFLAKFYHADMKEALSLMLMHNYIGITISRIVLQEEFTKMLSGQNNRFTICLENLNFSYNPIQYHIDEAILFLKWLYLSPMCNDETRKQSALSVFVHLIRGMSFGQLNLLRGQLNSQFKLLGKYRDEILGTLVYAATIIKPNKNNS